MNANGARWGKLVVVQGISGEGNWVSLRRDKVVEVGEVVSEITRGWHQPPQPRCQ